MSATFDAAQGWSVTGGITNLTDKRYIISGYSDLNFIGSTYGVYSRPREWYLKLGYSF
jgi:iron complex outermembrane recepter protein